MKKYIYFAAALAIVGAASCNKEFVENEVPEVSEVKLATLTATIGEPGTKTTLNNPSADAGVNTKTFWCADDKLSVLDGAANVEYTVQDKENYDSSEKAVFEGTELTDADAYYALYPYTEAASLEGGVIKGAVLPAEQTAVAGNIPDGAALAVAYTTDKSSLSFKNVATVIGFTLTEDAEKVEFVAKGGENLAGTIDITPAATDDAELTYTVQDQTGSSKVTLTDLAAGTYYFTILPDVTLTEGYEFYIDEVLAKSNTNNLTLDRSKIYSLGEVVKPVQTTAVYLKPNSNWLQDDARFAAYTWSDNSTAWYNMVDENEDGIYEVDVPETITGILFARMNPSFTDNRFNEDDEAEESKRLWNKTADLVLPTDENVCYVIKKGSWDDGTDDEWMTLDAAREYIEPADPVTVFGICGDLTSWGDLSDIDMQNVGGLFVAYGVQFTSAGNFKVRSNNSWDDNNWGLSSAGTVEAGKYYSVINESSSSNLTLAAGTYDIWLDTTLKRIYILKEGDATSSAAQGTPIAPLSNHWNLVGADGNWDANDNNKLVEEAGWYVLKNFTLTKDSELKFNSNGNWNINRKGVWNGINGCFDLTSGNGNIVCKDNKYVPKGTYDVYMNSDATKVYFLAPGLTPNSKENYRLYIKTSKTSTPYLYAWNGYATAGWPGEKLTLKETLSDNGECFYVEIPFGTGLAYFIINDNDTSQTADLGGGSTTVLPTGDLFYEWN